MSTQPSPTVDVTPQPVTFTTSDGIILGGRLFGSGKAGVVLAHMFPSDQESWKSFAELLAQEGYKVLTFDFRGYPASGGSRDVTRIDRDLEAALAFIRSQGITQVFLIGASMGGTAALKVAARDKVDGVVAFSAARNFAGLEVTDQELARLDEPVLYLAGQRDEPAAFAAQEMYDKTPQGAEIRTFSGGAHGSNLLRFSNAEEVEKLVLAFLKRHTR
jgi:pimeloyl-ACP methyl ester carboxylesterase